MQWGKFVVKGQSYLNILYSLIIFWLSERFSKDSISLNNKNASFLQVSVTMVFLDKGELI